MQSGYLAYTQKKQMPRIHFCAIFLLSWMRGIPFGKCSFLNSFSNENSVLVRVRLLFCYKFHTLINACLPFVAELLPFVGNANILNCSLFPK